MTEWTIPQERGYMYIIGKGEVNDNKFSSGHDEGRDL